MEGEAFVHTPLRTFAAEIDCRPSGRFRSEVYEFEPGRARCRQFWRLRWLVEFLGGSDVANFLGSLLSTLRNKGFDRLQSSCTGDEAELLLHKI